MAVLLAGGAGYIGSHTAVELLNAGYDVIIADNYANSSPIVAERVTQITGKPVKCYQVDVADQAALKQVFQENPIDSVIHFAGLKAVGESVRLPLDYYRNNLDSTLALLALMDAHGVRRLIFSSSATVYGKHASLPFREDAETGPCTNPYGWTKLFIEQIIRDYTAAHPDFSAVLLRYFNPVGAHESGLIGEDPRDIPNNLMPYIARVAVGTLPYLNVFGDDYPTPDGTGVRDYIHVTDLARVIWPPCAMPQHTPAWRCSIWEPAPVTVYWTWCTPSPGPAARRYPTASHHGAAAMSPPVMPT